MCKIKKEKSIDTLGNKRLLLKIYSLLLNVSVFGVSFL